MKQTWKTLLCLVLVVLFAAAALTLTGCQKKEPTAETSKTEAPTTEAPATEAPTTEAPNTEAPATEAPKTEAPATEVPETEALATEAPETEALATEAPETEAPATEAPETEAPATEAPETEEPTEPEEGAPVPTELGEGTKTFFFAVTHADGAYALFEIHTDADTVGDALTGVELIDGEDGQYGLYVTWVDGEYLDWNTDQMYWAFYENGEYAMTGVDGTQIDESVTYSFVATAG